MKTKVEKHFDKVAKSYDSGKEKYSFYYSTIKKLLFDLIGPNKNVMEYGCGTGDLLVSLHPKIGIGYDLSSEMIKKARLKYKNNYNLKFLTILPSNHLDHFDAVFLTDVIEHLEDVEGTFKKIKNLMGPKTLLVNTMANPLWEPMLMFWERMGWKMVEGPHKRIGYKDIKILSEKVGLKIIKHDYKLLIPIHIPVITNIANTYLEKYLKPFCFIEYFVAVKS